MRPFSKTTSAVPPPCTTPSACPSTTSGETHSALSFNCHHRPHFSTSLFSLSRSVFNSPDGTGPEIYFKREDLNHTGAHKINNSLGQALLCKRMGKKRIIAETGAGQHGVATATVCAREGLQCIVYMGAKDMERQASLV